MLNIQAYADRFKPCRRKAFEGYFCKVPIGSCVLDATKDAKVVALLGGKTFLSNVEVSELKRNQPDVYRLIEPLLTKAVDFVLNINGCLSLVTFAELTRDYAFADKSPITQQSILDKAYICEYYLGQLTPVRVLYNQAKDAAVENIVLRWQKIQYRGSVVESALACVDDVRENFRCYLPNRNEQYFIVCNGNESKVLTGKQFAFIYDLRGWSGLNTEENKEIIQPKELFDLSSRADTRADFTTLMYDYLKEAYKGSFAEKCDILTNLTVVKLADYCLSVKYLQRYEELQVNYLIYTRGSEYFLAQGDIDAPRPECLKKFLLSLEGKDKIVVKMNDLQKFKEILVAILGFTPVANVSNYYIPCLSINEFESLKSYSGSEYYKINKYLRGEECDNPFEAYLQATFIADVIDRTLIGKNLFHFRGLALPNHIKIKEGYVLENKCFASTALVSPVALSFGLHYDSTSEQGVVIVFRNSFRQHGIYINNFSVHKNTEFEVLYNIGYDFRFIQQLGHFSDEYGKCAVWLCELVETPERGIRKYAYKKDATEKLIYMLQSDGKLMKSFYIQSVKESEQSCRVTLKRYNVDDYLIRICLENGEFVVTFEGDIRAEEVFTIKEKGYQYLFQYIYHVLGQDKNFKPYVSTANIASFSERFMQDLCNYFIGNNFIISSQDVNKAWQDDVKVVSTFSILDSDLQAIDFEVVIAKEKEFIKLELEAEGRKRVFRKAFDKRFELFEEVYWAIVCKFNLDSTRRLKRIFAILGGFHECEIEFFKHERGAYRCNMDGKIFDIKLLGTSVVVSLNGNSVTLNYYDDIYTAASDIKTLL